MEYKLELVVVPVSDVDRAKAFYADQMEFTVDVDHQISDDMRVVEVTPPALAARSASARASASRSPSPARSGSPAVRRRHRGRARRPLSSRGVPISSIKHHDGTGFAEGKGDDWNSFIFFDDPDGNSWAIQESPTMRDAAKAT